MTADRTATPAGREGGLPLTLPEARRAVALSPVFPGARPVWVSAAGPVLEVRTHVSRAHPTLGLGLAQARVRAGAAVLNLRLAAAVGGRPSIVTLLPDDARPGVLAVLHRGAPAPPKPQDRALHAALQAGLARRSTLPVGPVAHVLRRAADTEGTWLYVLPAGPGLRRQARALPAAEAARLVAPGALALMVGGYRDRPEAQVRAGQAMQRVLLTAHALGLTAAALVAGLSVPARELGPFGGLRPQVLMVVDPAPSIPASAATGSTTVTA